MSITTSKEKNTNVKLVLYNFLVKNSAHGIESLIEESKIDQIQTNLASSQHFTGKLVLQKKINS